MTAYIYSEEYIKYCCKHPKFKNRAAVVHELIKSYGLLSFVKIICPKKASKLDLETFHSSDYVTFLLKPNDIQDDEDDEKLQDERLQYGLGYDCPLIAELCDYVLWSGGATLTAAQCLCDRICKIAINWPGGWHHAKKDQAQGFCYVNDIVLGILRLRTTFPRILYVDIDLHHGDGVEEAFAFAANVMTVSFHKKECGFYPGTGSVEDVGYGRGRYRAVNVPLRDGIKDEQYIGLFKRIVGKVVAKFQPNAVVFQCGADTISGDPMRSFALTPHAIGVCAQQMLQLNLPILFLGGGGYHDANTARCWTYLTSVILGKPISQDIPEHLYFPLYGPSYELSVMSSNRPNLNDDLYTSKLLEKIEGNLEQIT